MKHAEDNNRKEVYWSNRGKTNQQYISSGFESPEELLYHIKMRLRFWIIINIVLYIGLYPGIAGISDSYAVDNSGQLSEILRNRIEAGGVPPEIVIGDDVICSSTILPLFYEKRNYKPAWTDENGLLYSQADDLVRMISEAGQEGLRPENYHLKKLEKMLSEVRKDYGKKLPLNPYKLVDLDLLLSDAFLVYGSHLWAGSINPETLDPKWNAAQKEIDLTEVLQSALDSRQVEKSLKGLLPVQSGYAGLQMILAVYKRISSQGGWPTLPSGPVMKKGDRGERIFMLRQRLIIAGDIDQSYQDNGDLFDDALEEGVLRFQKRHGLDLDGVVGIKTLAALNVPVKKRIQQIELNMERWRWLPNDLGMRFILVNIANFELDVFENDELIMNMRVIVGKEYRRTPVFTGSMTYLVLNPYWYVPASLAVRDIVPSIRKDPAYLTKNNMSVFQGYGADSKVIEPDNVDWKRINTRNFPYRFRQDPGPDNALGRIKFMFPNKFNVYLHDTPSRELFAKNVRTFSSGCIRIQQPVELAEYILRNDPKWKNENIMEDIGSGKEKSVWLSTPVPVHILYWTAWMDEDGVVQFRNDIYGRDAKLAKAMLEKPPKG
ncbi:MAG: L,D-transpeptidase family protein [Nitrospirae bacterium]|nr:L,D-transpeptidase family protein [Nitrospirota bacterium]